MSALHILRYVYGRPGVEAFHLYPRYMDPVEMAMVLTAVALAGWSARSVVGEEQRDRPRGDGKEKWALRPFSPAHHLPFCF